MFLLKKKSKGYTYLYLADSVWDTDKGAAKNVIKEKVGRLDLLEKNEPQRLKELEEEYGNKEKVDDLSNSRVLEELLSTIKNGSTKPGSFPELRLAHQILRPLWVDVLKMPELFANLKHYEQSEIEYSPSEIALYLATLKLAEPVSHQRGFELSQEFLGDPLFGIELDSVYRCLTYLYERKDSIMKHVNKRLGELYPRNLSLLFYDCTNCYFETPYSDEYWYRRRAYRYARRVVRRIAGETLRGVSDKQLNELIDQTPKYRELVDDILKELGEPFRRNGDSKEKRYDLPLVSIALVIDENGMPVDFEVFAGNRSEQKTMVEAIRALKKKYHIVNAMVVADNGLNSTQNLNMLLSNKLGFVVAQSPLSLKASVIDQDLSSLKGFEPIKDEAGNDTGMLYKIVPFVKKSLVKNEDGSKETVTVKCNLMYTYSEKRKERDTANLNSLIERAQAKIDAAASISPTTHGATSLVSSEVPVEKLKAKGLKTKLIAKRRKCCGFAGVLYEPPPGMNLKLTPEYISGLYHRQVKIEECFRVMKHDFQIRPMHVYTREHIIAHVLICVLSLVILRLIQRKLAENKESLTTDEIKTALRNARALAIKTKDGYGFMNIGQIKVKDSPDKKGYVLGRDHVGLIAQALGTGALPQICDLSFMRRHFRLKALSISPKQEAAINMSRAS